MQLGLLVTLIKKSRNFFLSSWNLFPSKPTESFLLFYLFKNRTCDTNSSNWWQSDRERWKERAIHPRNWAKPKHLEISQPQNRRQRRQPSVDPTSFKSHHFLFRKPQPELKRFWWRMKKMNPIKSTEADQSNQSNPSFNLKQLLDSNLR